jgi:hypothetical protein
MSPEELLAARERGPYPLTLVLKDGSCRIVGQRAHLAV